MFKKIISLAAAMCAISGGIAMGETLTNYMSVSSARFLSLKDSDHEIILEENDTWARVFESKISYSANKLMFDSFGPFSTLWWYRMERNLGYGSSEKLNDVGRDTVAKVAMDSLRESAVVIFHAAEWQDFGDDLFDGIVGNTAEEQISESSAFNSTGFDWWDDDIRYGGIHYGVRLGGNPYVYAKYSFGHWFGKPIMTIETRIREEPFHNGFSGAPNIQQFVVLPLSPIEKHLYLGLAFNIRPLVRDSNDPEWMHASVGLSYAMGQAFDHAAFNIRVERDGFHWGVIGGISIPL